MRKGNGGTGALRLWGLAVLCLALSLTVGCSSSMETVEKEEQLPFEEIPADIAAPVLDASEEGLAGDETFDALGAEKEGGLSEGVQEDTAPDELDAALSRLNLTQDFRDSFVHGDKPASFQKYIVLHDTEGSGTASSVVDWWDGNGAGVAAHFIVNRDGTIVQAVPLDKIAHHAGYGDTGHNEEFGVEEDGRDDMVGTVPIGSWAPDYGMNGSSIGIEMVHVSGSGDYPTAQLEALDNLIAYIDAYYGFESAITDHKAWRTGNSDTSPEFAGYLECYQAMHTHATR